MSNDYSLKTWRVLRIVALRCAGLIPRQNFTAHQGGLAQASGLPAAVPGKRSEHARSGQFNQTIQRPYGAGRAESKIEPGEVFCLLGANGAGKTTTINLFLNFVEPTRGTAKINGLDVTQQPLETKRFIAYIPEQVMLYKNLTGLENLEYFSALAGHDQYSRAQLLGFFAEVGLQGEAAAERVGTYSKGMRQKVGSAIALAKQARALLLDEPTSGLDPKASNEFSALLSLSLLYGISSADPRCMWRGWRC